jgi:GNAT superfamily N-acetyltransferase
MSIPDEISLRTANARDLPAIGALREAAGWAVHEWALRAAIEPPHARGVVAVVRGRDIVGVGSGISYGTFGVVGNMVVHPDHRRLGIGAAILEEVLGFLEGCAVRRIELSATDAGRPLYARYGFEQHDRGASAVVPRSVDLDGSRADEITVVEAGPADAASLAAYDAPRFGGDRRSLLETMFRDPERPALVARRHDRIVGWGWIRPDAQRLGPLVADTPVVALALIGEAFHRLPGTVTLRLNLPPANRGGVDALRAAGAALESWDGRMARGPDVDRRDETIYASTVGALG